MAPSSSAERPQGVKRKKPPTFQHLPVERGMCCAVSGSMNTTHLSLRLVAAKKLKRSWVEVQKIKSKWKAQKRKEGLLPSRPQLEREAEAVRESSEEAEHRSDSSGASEAQELSEESEEEGGDEEDVGDEPQSKVAAVASGKTRGHPQKSTPRQKTEEQPTLRELQRMAYSRSSLHTHKSNPLHRHKGPADTRGRGGAVGGREGRGGQSSRGRSRGRGRGQPDMGLRMKAMLEQIKQNYT